MIRQTLVTLLAITITPLIAVSVSFDAGIAQFDMLDSGAMINISVNRELTDNVNAGLNIGYFTSDFDSERDIAKITNPPDPDITIQSNIEASFLPVQLTVENQIPLSGPVSPFIAAGFGWGFLSEDVIPLDSDYRTSDYTGYGSYNGPVLSGTTGIDILLNPSVSLGARFSYLYANMTAEEDLNHEGFAQVREELTGYVIQTGVSYRF